MTHHFFFYRVFQDVISDNLTAYICTWTDQYTSVCLIPLPTQKKTISYNYNQGRDECALI